MMPKYLVVTDRPYYAEVVEFTDFDLAAAAARKEVQTQHDGLDAPCTAKVYLVAVLEETDIRTFY